MYFVGRIKELNQMKTAIISNENVIIYGKYGIGRTSLVRHFTAMNQKKWQFLFADFSQSASQVCQQLHNAIFPAERDQGYIQYKKARRRIVNVSKDSAQKFIIVLDNVNHITHQRIDFLYFLICNGRFSFIVIVDNSLSPSKTERLRAILHLNCQIFLTNLTISETISYFEFYFRKYNWQWSDEMIKLESKRTRGYPLFMVENLANILKIYHLNDNEKKF